jgi:hypothetical protein
VNIVSGSGKRREVFVFPDASIVNKSPESEQVAARYMLCRMLNVPVMEDA